MEDFKNYWNTWLWRDATRRIITINFIVWLAAAVLSLTGGANRFVDFLALPASASALPYRFWTPFTYMWVQLNFLHLLCNMLWFLLFGEMLEHAIGGRRLAWIYVIGGLAGAAAFIVANIVSPGIHPVMIGASCSVGAVIGAAMVMMPNWRLNLMIIGEAKVIWIAVAAIVFFAVTETSVYVGIAHAAGLGAGAALALLYRRSAFAIKMPRIHRRPATPQGSASDEQRLDQLLDLVNRSGYASLSAAQRQELFELSQRLKK